MAKSAPRLGRGLSALITPREERDISVKPEGADGRDQVQQVPVEQIRRNPRQPRSDFDEEGIRSLADSIRSSGVIQPIVVRPVAGGQYELVAGERRWRAARVAGLAAVPAIVRSVSDSEALQIALTENLQREDLNALERAAAYREYVETFSVSVEELARRLGESRANVANYLRLLALQDEIKKLIVSGQLGMGQARAIAGVADQRRQLALARLAVRRNLAVRRVEELVRDEGAPVEKVEGKAESPGQNAHLAEVEAALSRALGLKVKLQAGRKKNSGRVIIPYRNLEEFDRIAEIIGGRAVVE